MLSASAFVAFCLVCTVLAFTRHPIWGLYFYMATTYIYPPGRWWGQMFGELRWALIAAAVTALAVMFHRGKLQSKPVWIGWGPAVILVLYCAWMWIQVGWALDTDEQLRGSTEFVKCLLAMWLVYRVVDSKERVRDLMLAHVLGCTLLAFYAYQTGRSGDRLDGVGGPNLDDSNTLAVYLITAAIAGAGLVMTQRAWRRVVALLCLPLIVNGFVLANSRGAFLGLIGGALVLIYCTARQHRSMLWPMAAVGLIGLAVLVDKTFVDRMFTIQDVTSKDEDADPSARSRVVIAQAQLEMFVENPMGVGWRGTAVLSPRFMDERWLTVDANKVHARSSHSTYMTALTEQGIPGAILYVGLLIWVVTAALRVRRLSRSGSDPQLATMGAALLGAIVVVLVSGLSADNLIKEVQFWLYAGLVSVLWLGESAQPAATSNSTTVALTPSATAPAGRGR